MRVFADRFRDRARRSVRFLNTIMTCKSDTCIDIIGATRCTGCFGCQSACPKDAIELALDTEGFYLPVVDRQQCDGCGLCCKRCPVLVDGERSLSTGHWAEPPAFAAWTVDDSLRLASSSGGVFGELAELVLRDGGAVAGCVWGENWTPRHILTVASDGVAEMRGSKYVPSHVGDLYRQVIDRLRGDPGPVLFSGTPCQVAAMAAALNEEQRSRVLLAEVICHGVPSLRAFHLYLKELFDGDKVTSYTFRDKALGWYSVLATSARGQGHHVPTPSDAFFQGCVVHHLYVMASCHACPFARIPRVGDLTLGDFWGCPEPLHDKRGVSVVLANTQAGQTALEALRESGRVQLESTSLAVAVAKNPRAIGGNYPMPRRRQAFLKGLAAGKEFHALRTAHFPSRLQRVWNAYCRSSEKSKFLADVILTVLRRLHK